MNHTKTGRQCYKCGEGHNSDSRHHSVLPVEPV